MAKLYQAQLVTHPVGKHQYLILLRICFVILPESSLAYGPLIVSTQHVIEADADTHSLTKDRAHRVFWKHWGKD